MLSTRRLCGRRYTRHLIVFSDSFPMNWTVDYQLVTSSCVFHVCGAELSVVSPQLRIEMAEAFSCL